MQYLSESNTKKDKKTKQHTTQ